MTIYNVVKKLVGSIYPYGATEIDNERLNNLDEHGELTYSLLVDLVETASFRNRDEASIKTLADNAYDNLLIIKKYINENVN